MPRVILSKSVRDEIVECAARSQRSVAFVVANLLRASPLSAAVIGERVALEIDSDDSDPRDIAVHIKQACGAANLDERVTGSWAATRERMIAWAARQERSSWSDAVLILDRSTADAEDPTSSPTRLAELADSPFPTVRVLVAQNPSTAHETRMKLATDAQKKVRIAAGSGE